jgi:hypothetical protein
MPPVMTKREAMMLRAWRLEVMPIERVIIARTTKFVPPAKSVLRCQIRCQKHERRRGTICRSGRSMLWRRRAIGSRLTGQTWIEKVTTCDEESNCEVIVVKNIHNNHCGDNRRLNSRGQRSSKDKCEDICVFPRLTHIDTSS